MPLVTSAEMLQRAYREGYAIGAFNVSSAETIKATVQAAKETHSPVIIQILENALHAIGPRYFKHLIEAAVEECDLPICVHLDHGSSFEACKEFIALGFPSVMIDGSQLPFEENIALTRQVVEFAHDAGAVVEAELGSISGAEGTAKYTEASCFTDPVEAAEFVARTGCDSLAISIGTSHGAYKFPVGSNPRLRFDILDAVAEQIPGLPIVLHGASSVPAEAIHKINLFGGRIADALGVPEDQLHTAAQKAVCKINMCSDQLLEMTAVIREMLAEHPEQFEPSQYILPAQAAVQAQIMHKMTDVLGCAGKA